VIFGGIKLWLDASIRENRATRSGPCTAPSASTARRELSGRPAREARSGSSSTSAPSAFYDLVRDGRRQEVVEAWEQLRRERLSAGRDAAIFQDVVDRFRTDLSLAAYERGLEHARMARYAEA
jgi:SH3-like domain-containing protein